MKKHILLLLSILTSVCLTACSTRPKSEKISITGIYFDTIIQIDVWGADSSTMEGCKELCQKYENLLSSQIDTSEISKINNSEGAPVTVSDETVEVLQKGIYYSELSRGKFDITIAPVSELWNFRDNEESLLPEKAALANACTHVNYQNIQIEGNTVTLTDPQTQIDLGGIAKGYIADRLKEYLLSEGVEHALINLGGNTLAVGTKYDGSPFRIGIQKPFSEKNEVITAVEITDRSVVSSGIYQRYFEKDGRIYHHILNPDTGYPYENNLLQVTIISDQSVDGDALSTCCFALGLKDGSKLIESLDNVQAIFVTNDYELHYAGK